MDFSFGSLDMLELSHNYAHSSSEQFIFSDFRYLTLSRWNQLWPLQFLNQLVFWVFTVFLVLHSIFFRELAWLKSTVLAIMGVLFAWELIQLVSYCTFVKSG